MRIIRDNEFGTRSDGTIHEFIVINIFLYQTKMDKGILKNSGRELCDCLNNIESDFSSCLYCQYFLIL